MTDLRAVVREIVRRWNQWRYTRAFAKAERRYMRGKKELGKLLIPGMKDVIISIDKFIKTDEDLYDDRPAISG